MTKGEAAAETIAAWVTSMEPDALPPALVKVLRRVLIDAGGLMVASRHAGYVQAIAASADADGACTAIGHERAWNPGDAALIMGTGVHGEDFDDTFEGTPVHVGAVVVPAVLAAAESRDRAGPDALKGMAAGAEIMCRMALVAPTAIHSAGFHPTAVIGAIGASATAAATLGLSVAQTASALGIAGSMASGIIEYLAEGTSTKRLHPGWAAHSGFRAARLAEEGFTGPRTVLDGVHGFFKAFADPSVAPDFSVLTEGLGETWRCRSLAFKPFACGTMIQPFIDCAIALRSRIPDLSAIEEIVARVGERTVHRLWEPREEKVVPTTPYSAKFSGPYGIAVGLAVGAAGLEQFTPSRIADKTILALASKVRHEIDPKNEYPGNYTGELIIRLAGGTVLEQRQPHLRGGVREPLGDAEIAAKFRANASFGGWPDDLASAFLAFAETAFTAPDFSALGRFRG